MVEERVGVMFDEGIFMDTTRVRIRPIKIVFSIFRVKRRNSKETLGTLIKILAALMAVNSADDAMATFRSFIVAVGVDINSIAKEFCPDEDFFDYIADQAYCYNLVKTDDEPGEFVTLKDAMAEVGH